MIMYKLSPKFTDGNTYSVVRLSDGACIPFNLDNTDYQAFKLQVLNYQPTDTVDSGDSFSLNVDTNLSILEDADGVKMTIDEAKAFIGTLP